MVQGKIQVISVAFAFLLSVASLLILLKTPLGNLAMDRPNERSLHSRVIPRTGGLAIMIPILVTWLFMGTPQLWIWLSVLLLGVSLLDDVYNLSILKRLGIQVLACLIFIGSRVGDISWAEFSILLLGMIWLTNLYNFMDGSDGLAGGMAVLGFGAYAVPAYMGNYPQIAAMAAVVSAASLAFLLFNFQPARIFMGDSGSIPLGFLAGAIGIYGWKMQLWPAWFPLLVFSPFIVDASITLMKRLFKRENFLQAHKDHYYQRLIRMGWSHRKTAIAEYVLMLAAGSSAIALIDQGAWVIYLSLAVWFIAYVALICAIDKKWRVVCAKS